MSQRTTNKSERTIDQKFNQEEFNKQFIKNDKSINVQKDDTLLNNPDEVVINILPHQRPITDIIILLREFTYKVLEMLVYKQNPLPYIFSTIENQFIFSLLLIIIGGLLLLFSNLMKSPPKEDTKLGFFGL